MNLFMNVSCENIVFSFVVILNDLLYCPQYQLTPEGF